MYVIVMKMKRRMHCNKSRFPFHQGKKIAVLGKSGAGKSTLLQLLLGQYQPTAGSIMSMNKPLKVYGDYIFEIMSVLNQKPYLFATKLKIIYDLGEASATFEEE